MSSPFECPICYEVYDDSSREPVTLPCGHSCCLSHIRTQGMSNCMTCRDIIRNAFDLHVNFQLRDAAMLAGSTVLNFAGTAAPTQDYEAVAFDSSGDLSVRVLATPNRDVSPTDTYDFYDVMPAVVSPDATGGWRAPVDIVLVVDISGSMGTEVECPGGQEAGGSLTKMQLVIHAMQTIVQVLNSNDRLGIVTFTSRAEVISPLVQMNDANKRDLKIKINSLRPDADTNLWAGIKAGYTLLNSSVGLPSSGGVARGVGGLFVLTDGEATASTNPPRGIVPSLQRLRETTPLGYGGFMYTFAFGYQLDSRVLSDLAVFGEGIYSFLPDGGFVGTCFINNLANMLSVVATDAVLKIEVAVDEGVEIVESSILSSKNIVKSDWGYTVPVGAILGGQDNSPFCFSIKVPKGRAAPIGEDGALVSVSLQYTCTKERRVQSLIKNSASELSLKQIRDASPLDAQEVQAQKFRVSLVQLLNALFPKDRTSHDMKALFELPSHTLAAHEKVRVLSGSLTSYLNATSDIDVTDLRSPYKRIAAMREDLDGQVAEATSRVDWMTKWGMHYLPSLSRAHDLQQRNNFKDKGIQLYGNELFCRWRDAAEDIFLTIEPPIAVARSRFERGPGAPGVSMQSYYNMSAGCFHEESLILLEDGTSTKQCKDVRRGDVVYGGGVVECVMETVVTNSVISLVHVAVALVDPHRSAASTAGQPGGQVLRLTPWHPIRVYDAKSDSLRWQFPSSLLGDRSSCEGLCKKVDTNCNSVYSFVITSKTAHGDDIQYKSEIVVDGITAITLCHNIRNDQVASHPFFGTESVVDSLRRSKDYASAGGVVRVRQGVGFVRDSNGLICDLVHDT